MEVECSQELKPIFEEYKTDLQIQTIFMQEDQIMIRYLNRGFGNAYDFDQRDRLFESI